MATAVMGTQQRIERLRIELQACKDDISEHLTTLYDGSGASNSTQVRENDPRNMMKMLQQEILVCLQTAQERRNYRTKFMADVDSCRGLVDVVRKVSNVTDMIVRCDGAIGGFDLKLAWQLLADTQQSLEAELPAPNTEIGTGAVCRVIRRETRLLSSRYHAKLCRLLSQSIVSECGKLCVTKETESGIPLIDIWECLVRVNGAVESVYEMVDGIWQALLKPLWRIPCDDGCVQPVVAIMMDEYQSEIVLTGVIDETALSTSSHDTTFGACKIPFPHLLQQVGEILHFVATEVFANNPDVLRLAAGRLNDGSSPLVAVLVDTLTALVPRSESELAAFQQSIQQPCRDFELQLSSLGLLPSPPDGGTAIAFSLTNAVSELPARFADTRRKEILGRGRDMLLSDYHNTMVATDVGEDGAGATGGAVLASGATSNPLATAQRSDPSASLNSLETAPLRLHFASCQVSLAACRVLALVNEVLSQACQPDTSPALAAMLYQSARDCLELFLAIIPVRFADVIDTVPRMGAVLYNDCCYLAHHCTVLTHTYQDALAHANPALSNTAGFVDFIARFGALGERCLAGHLDEQRATLAELVLRVGIDPSSERSKHKGGPGSGAGSGSGLLAPRVASAVGAVGAAVGGALLKRIGGFGGIRGDDRLTLTGALQEAAGGKASAGSGSSHGHIASQGNGHGQGGLSGLSGGGQENDEESAALVVRHLERLRGQWQGVLQDEVYVRAVGYLLEGVVRALMQPILESECITECAAGDICRAYRVVLRSHIIFPPTANHPDPDRASHAVPSWRKFVALCDLLEYSLSDVAEWLPRRKFISFTGGEMSSLIGALFEDSSRRQAILKSIAEMTS